MLVSSREARAFEFLSELVYDVRAFALAHPDGGYDPHGAACSYVKGTSYDGDQVLGAGCLIGQAVLVDRPVDDVLFPLTKGQPNQLGTGYIDGDIHEVCEAYLGLAFSGFHESASMFMLNTMVGWLMRVQTEQDAGKPWGDAIVDADEWVAEQLRYL